MVVKAVVSHGRDHEADAVADTVVVAAKGLMRSGGAHVSKVQFDDRMSRLVAWVVN
jgi:hypothetical protein